jgi:hypothetical protein
MFSLLFSAETQRTQNLSHSSSNPADARSHLEAFDSTIFRTSGRLAVASCSIEDDKGDAARQNKEPSQGEHGPQMKIAWVERERGK